MATFKTRVESVIGTVSSTALLDVWLSSGAKFILVQIPSQKLMNYAQEITFTTSASLWNRKLIGVTVGGYDPKQISPGKITQVIDATSIHYATALTPAYTVRDNNVYSYPAGTSSTLLAINFPDVVNTDTSIANFPPELEEGVVLYSCITGLLQRSFDRLATDIALMTYAVITVPTAPTVATLSFSVIPTAPTLTLPSIPVPPGSLTITLPTAPTAPSVPTLVVPTVPTDNLTVTTTLPTFVMPVAPFDITNAGTYVRTDEDLEKGASELQIQQAILAKYNEDIQAASSSFQSEISKYTTELTNSKTGIEIKYAKHKSELDNYGVQLQKFQTELTKYSAEINSYQAKLQSVQVEITKYGADTDVYRAELQGYQTQLQVLEMSLKEYETKLAGYNMELSKYKMQLENYMTQIQLYATQVQSYGAQVQNETNRIGVLTNKIKIYIETNTALASTLQAQLTALIQGFING